MRGIGYTDGGKLGNQTRMNGARQEQAATLTFRLNRQREEVIGAQWLGSPSEAGTTLDLLDHGRHNLG